MTIIVFLSFIVMQFPPFLLQRPHIYIYSVNRFGKPQNRNRNRNYRNRTDTETDMFGSVNYKTETGPKPKPIGSVRYLPKPIGALIMWIQ